MSVDPPDPRRPRRQASAAAEPTLRIRTVKAADLPAVVALDATVTGLHKAAYWQRVYRRYGIRARASATSWWPRATAASAAS